MLGTCPLLGQALYILYIYIKIIGTEPAAAFAQRCRIIQGFCKDSLLLRYRLIPLGYRLIPLGHTFAQSHQMGISLPVKGGRC